MLDRRFFLLVPALLAYASEAWATQACTQRYSLGGATFESDDSLSFLMPIDGELVWQRARPGAAPEMVVRTGLRAGEPESGDWTVPRFWAAGSTALHDDGTSLVRIDASGTRSVLSCDLGFRSSRYAVERSHGHFNVAQLCDQALRIFVLEDGAEPRMVVQTTLEIGVSGFSSAPLAVTEFAIDRYALVVDELLVGFEDGHIDQSNPPLGISFAGAPPRFVTDVGGTSLFVLGGVSQRAILRLDRSADTGWQASSAPMPLEVPDARSLVAADRDTVVVDGFDEGALEISAHLVRRAGDAWRFERAVAIAGTSLAARGPGLRVAFYREDDDLLALFVASESGVEPVGSIGDHLGQYGCCSLVGAAPERGSIWPFVLGLALLLLAARRLRRQTH